MKRLFLFAGYDKDGILDDTLIRYLNQLSELGDIILVMDCNIQDTSKLNDIKNLLHFETVRHGEYDFGSYKRGYMWAHDNKILGNYDWVYLVNDSVYGPLFNLEPCLNKLESRNTDLTGMTDFCDRLFPKHVQSWFVGFSKKLATSNLIYDFMQNIEHRNSKLEIICKYEVGLSRTILQNGFEMSTLFSQNGRKEHTVYERPRQLLEKFIPFIKKTALKNLGGGAMLLLPYTSDDFITKIFANANRTNLEYQTKDIFIQNRKIYRLTFLSIPICTIYRKDFTDHKCYRIYLFDKIRILKIVSAKPKDS